MNMYTDVDICVYIDIYICVCIDVYIDSDRTRPSILVKLTADENASPPQNRMDGLPVRGL